MTQGQIDSLQIILKSDTVRDALQVLFQETVDNSLPMIGDEDDTQLGQKYRAYQSAQHIIGKAFSTLDSYRVLDKDKAVANRHI